MSTFIILINVTWNVEEALSNSLSETEHMTRSQLGFLWGLFSSNCLGMNFADSCTNELEFRICTNCKNIQYIVYKPFEKMSTSIINVCEQRLLFFTINALTFNTRMHDTVCTPSCTNSLTSRWPFVHIYPESRPSHRVLPHFHRPKWMCTSVLGPKWPRTEVDVPPFPTASHD